MGEQLQVRGRCTVPHRLLRTTTESVTAPIQVLALLVLAPAVDIRVVISPGRRGSREER